MDEAVARTLRRLSRRHEPGVWVGAVRRAFGPVAEVIPEPGGARIESHAPHYLIALWKPLKPDRPFLRRWPNLVTLVAPNAQKALDEMLRHVPAGERLWLTRESPDWALLAEIVMIGEAGLEPWHFRELKAFVDAQRIAALAEIRANYGGRERGFEHFLKTVPGLSP